MVFNSILDLYLQNLRKICTMLNLYLDTKYRDDVLDVKLKHVESIIHYQEIPESVEYELRHLLYTEMTYNEYTKELLQDSEVKLSTLNTLPILIDKLYTKSFIEYLRKTLYSVKKKGQRSLQIEMQNGVKYFVTEMRDGKADIYMEKDMLQLGVNFQDVMSVINKSLGADNKTLDVLIGEFIHKLKVTDWVDERYDKHNRTTILETESYGYIYITRLSSLLYVIRSDYCLPMLITAENFNGAVTNITTNKKQEYSMDNICKRFMVLIADLLGTDYVYEDRGICKNGEPYITRVGEVLTTPQVTYHIDSQYKAMLQILRRIVTQQRRGYTEI